MFVLVENDGMLARHLLHGDAVRLHALSPLLGALVIGLDLMVELLSCKQSACIAN